MSTRFFNDLQRIVLGNGRFMAILRAVREIGFPQGYVGAGALRSLVWDALHDRPLWAMPGDIDVVYFDKTDLSEASQSACLARLRKLEPDIPWEVINQAGVHLWYEHHFGRAVPPLSTLEEAIATWPEYATCVAVRLTDGDQLDVVAPYGLDDLFSMTIRHNPTRVSFAEYRQRTQAKRYAEQWPRVKVILEQE